MLRLRYLALVGFGAAAIAAVGAATADWDRDDRRDDARPIVIGHRGASGYLPEHTLESYALAIELGADYIEPDLVSTKDGHLIARHEPMLGGTTDVAAKFPGREKTRMLDGFPVTDFFAVDFTLAEIKTLRAKQPVADRPQQFNGKFEIPTFDEVIELAKRKSKEKGRTIGIYPETKHPTFHRDLKLTLEPRLLKALDEAGWNHRKAPVIIQSFEQSNLKWLRQRTKVRLVQLVDANDVKPDGTLDFTAPFDRPYDWTASGKPELLARTFEYFTTEAGLKEVKTYADGIGPWKVYIVRGTMLDDANGDGKINESDRRLLPPTDLVRRAHRHGLLVHPYTFRNEQIRLAFDYKGNPVNEYLQFYKLKVDGMFSDFPDTAFASRILFELEKHPDAARCLTGDRDGPRRHQPECPGDDKD